MNTRTPLASPAIPPTHTATPQPEGSAGLDEHSYIITTMDPTRPPDSRWSAIHKSTYDGAEDSPTRYQIGFGRDMEEATRDLKEKMQP